MTAAARGARKTAEPGGGAPPDGWARRQQQAEWMIDRLVISVREAAARTAARAREAGEDVWAEAEQLRRNGSSSG
jgi:hypothetical protein